MICVSEKLRPLSAIIWRILGCAVALASSLLLMTVPTAAGPFPFPFDLSTLDGTNGFALNGATAGSESGFSVSAAGDVNGDGINDLLISSSPGQTHVVFGRPQNSPFPAILELSTLNGTNGFALSSPAQSVSGGGDVNGDGNADLVIGATGQGKNYVVFGRPQGSSFPPVLQLSSLDGTTGFVFNAGGSSVSLTKDVNGDGIDDIVIGDPEASPPGRFRAGQTYVVFGRPPGSSFPAGLKPSKLNGKNGFIINGVTADDLSGVCVSAAGDVNGDGLADILISAPNNNPNRTYAVFGRPLSSPFPVTLELSSLDGSNGFVMNGLVRTGPLNDRYVSGAGDINGDGIDDLLIGEPPSQTFVVFGRPHSSPFPASLELAALDGTNGFVVKGITGASGRNVSGAGDINGDGLDDFLIAAANISQVYLVFGRSAAFPFPAAFELSKLDGNNGSILNGSPFDSSGKSLAGLGDINGDGRDDILIGAVLADLPGKPRAGKSYVVFGKGFCAENVTSSMRIARQPMVFDPATQLFVQRVRLTNIGTAPIPDPVYLVLDNLTPKTRLVNQNGVTTCGAPLGSPYAKANVNGPLLAPGDAAIAILKFKQNTQTTITYTPRVLAGGGPR